MTLLLDSDVIVDFLRGREPTRSFVIAASDAGEMLATTALNVGEVLRGEPDPTARDVAMEFLGSLDELPIDARVAAEFARFMGELDRAGQRMPVVDGFIAAAALVHGADVATRNAKHFKRVPGLRVRAPWMAL